MRTSQRIAGALLLVAGMPTIVLAQGSLEISETEPSQIDNIQDSMSTSVNEVAQWFDSFFEDERYIIEEASSRVRLRPSLLLEEGEAADPKFSIGASINLPRFNKKLKLIISDVDDDENDPFNSGRFADSEPDETNVGLQYTLRDKDRLNTSLSVGIKTVSLGGASFFLGPRMRKTWQLEAWLLRLTERVRWYTDIGWESHSSMELDRVVNTNWLFRQAFDLRARDDDYNEKGLRHNMATSFIQKLRSRAAVEYQWSTNFVTRPNHRVDKTGLRLRYRKQFWKKWLFYEINPQVLFRNKDDFRPTPGIVFRLEASFGDIDRKLKKARRAVR